MLGLRMGLRNNQTSSDLNLTVHQVNQATLDLHNVFTEQLASYCDNLDVGL